MCVVLPNPLKIITYRGCRWTRGRLRSWVGIGPECRRHQSESVRSGGTRVDSAGLAGGERKDGCRPQNQYRRRGFLT